MIFLKPEYLYLMLPPALVLFFFIITNKSDIDRLFDKKVLERVRFDDDTLGRVGRNMMIAVATLLMLLSLARPVKEIRDLNVTSKKIDILVALDISRSMGAKDIYPDRLSFAKDRVEKFIDRFKEANVGILAFGDEAFLVSPVTNDRSTLKYLLRSIDFDTSSQKATSLFAPLELASRFLKQSSEKVLVIFSDGGDKESFREELALAKELHEKVFLYLTATEKGAPLFDEHENMLKDRSGEVVLSKQNPHIKELTEGSGGDVVVYGFGTDSLDTLIKKIKEKVAFHKESSRHQKLYKEYFYYPLALALIFMLFVFSSLPQKSSLVIVFISLVLIGQNRVEAFDFFDIRDADRAYKEHDYKKALKLYQKLAISDGSDKSLYNLASIYYRLGEYKKALLVYKKIAPKERELEFKTHFNRGNCYFMLKDFQRAIKEFEEALKIRDDVDARYNLELCKKMLKKQKKKEQKQNQKKKDDQKKQRDTNQKQSDKKSNKSQKQKEKKLTKRELKQWKKELQKLKVKIKPMKLKTIKYKRDPNEKPW